MLVNAGAPHLAGPVLETFVVMELVKAASLSRLRPTLHPFRTGAGAKVDIVLENRRRDLVGIEVKAASTVQASDFKGLRELRRLVGDRLKAGVVLYTGGETVPFGDGLWAIPVPGLWAPQATAVLPSPSPAPPPPAAHPPSSPRG
jgi:hypothetical protein